MKTITQLSGVVAEDPNVRLANVRAAHVVEPLPGFMLRVTVGDAGVVVSRPPHGFCIPLAEILRLAAENEPAFLLPAVGEPAKHAK